MIGAQEPCIPYTVALTIAQAARQLGQVKRDANKDGEEGASSARMQLGPDGMQRIVS